MMNACIGKDFGTLVLFALEGWDKYGVIWKMMPLPVDEI